MGGKKPKGTSNRFWSAAVEKMKRLAVPVEGRLLCVVCKVPCPAESDVVVGRASDSANRNGYAPEDSSVHPDDLVVNRVHESIKSCGYACIFLKDFDNLKMMYDVDWSKMHRDIFQHKKKDAYALLYSGELSCAAENAMKNDFKRKISTIVDNYQSFSINAQVEILTIEGIKTNGQHLTCDFIDVTHAEVILKTYKKSHGAGGDTVRVEPHPDEV